MARLNEDAVRLVLEIIYHADLQPPWARLASLSLVSKAWSNHAQVLLYAHVRIYTPHQLQSFLVATDPKTERGRHLGDAVRILAVTVFPVAYITRVPYTLLPRLLSRCSKLYELRIVLEEMEGWPQETIEELEAETPPIMALRIRDSTVKGDAARRLLHIWPSIRHLTLRSSRIDLLKSNDGEPAPKFCLYELRWENMHGPSTDFLHWLLNYNHAGKNRAYLRILHLSAFPPDDNGDLAACYGPHLHALRIPHADRELIQSAKNLREVCLFDGREIDIDFLLSLPSTVQHIGFGMRNTRITRLPPLEHIFKLKNSQIALENLKIVTVFLSRLENGDWSDEWPSLRRKAEDIGVELVRQENRSLIIGGTEDLIATTDSLAHLLSASSIEWHSPSISSQRLTLHSKKNQ